LAAWDQRPLGIDGYRIERELLNPRRPDLRVTCTAGAYNRVDGLAIDDFARRMIDRTVAELKEELAAVKA
jgi:hypothetical protein